MRDRISILNNPLFDYTLSGLLLFRLFLVPFFPNDFQGLLFNIVGTLIYINLVLVVKKYREQVTIIVFVLFIFGWVLFFTGHEVLSTISSILNMLLFLSIVTVFITSLASTHQVNAKIILHAINGYLLLGVIAGIGIEIIMLVDSSAIAFPPQDAHLANGVNRLSEYQYFGLSTLTTLGIGEIVPVSAIARSFVTLLTMAGQLYLAIIIAMLVGKYATQKNDIEHTDSLNE